MSQEPNILVEHRQTKERPESVELTRGAKGVYRWTIKVYAGDGIGIASRVALIDSKLRELFGQPDLEG